MTTNNPLDFTLASSKPEPGTDAWRQYWAARIDAAQAQATVELQGQTWQRIRYGDDYAGSPPQCRDCGVALGQLHVPTCCCECCPRCGAQAISCDCLSEN